MDLQKKTVTWGLALINETEVRPVLVEIAPTGSQANFGAGGPEEKFRRFGLSCAQPRKRNNFRACARFFFRTFICAKPRFLRSPRFGGENPAFFNGACSIFFRA